MKQPSDAQKYVTREVAIEMHSSFGEWVHSFEGESETFTGGSDIIKFSYSILKEVHIVTASIPPACASVKVRVGGSYRL